MQVKLDMYFAKAFPKPTIIQREVPSFEVSAYRADFMIAHPEYQHTIIESKCESGGQDKPGKFAFWNAHAKDLWESRNCLIDPHVNQPLCGKLASPVKTTSSKKA